MMVPKQTHDDKIKELESIILTQKDELNTLMKEKIANEEMKKVLNKMPNNMGYIFQKYGPEESDCSFTYVSEGSYNIYNIAPSVIINNPLTIITLIVPDDVSSFINSVNNSYKTLNTWEWIGKCNINGIIKTLQCKSYPELITETPQRIVKWYGCVTDVSETANTLDEYKQLVEKANAPIIGVDKDLKINVWNSNIENLTGYTKKEVLDINLITLIEEEHQEEVKNILSDTLIGKESSNYNLPFLTKDSSMIDLLINSTSRRDTTGQIIGAIGIAKDVTELKKEIKHSATKEYELDLYQKVVASVFHEVRNPLNVTMQIFNILKEKFESSLALESSSKIDTRESILEVIEYINVGVKCSEQKLKVLNGILNMTQLEQGKLVLKSESISFKSFCSDIINMFKVTAKKNVDIYMNCPDICINSDEKHLNQILVNILSNASKIITEGYIRLDIDILEETSSEYILNFKIIDTGNGLTDIKIKQLLEGKKFEHGGFKHGSGIGLSIVIGILNLMNSKLEITSPYPNETKHNGSCFHFTVKFTKGVLPTVVNEGTITNKQFTGDLNILIVDDDKFNHKVLTKQLQKKLVNKFTKQPQISSVYSGEDCLTYLQDNNVDIIVMDQVMDIGKLLGDETVKEIRKFNKDVIIIQSSGNCTEEDNCKYFSAGVNHVWGKPVPIKKIEDDIYYLLKNSQHFINFQNKD